MLRAVISVGSAPSLYNEDPRPTEDNTRVEAGSNTSTVTLRVVGGDEKGSLNSETVKYGREYQGTWTRERLRWEDPPAYTKDRSVLSSERASHGIKNVTVRRILYSERKKISGHKSQMWLDTKTY
jgi:hypothetical protein